MNDYRTQLKNLLQELFQFDTADLDFGIYRIMNQRRAEIDAFIEHGLLDIVAQELGLVQAGVLAQKQEELEQQRRELVRILGKDTFDPSGEVTAAYRQTPLAQEFIVKQEEVQRAAVSADAEAGVFNALFTFFSRYYDDGDFITQRRYSHQPKYAVPYNGEEVLLHWANRDQYYVKTADVLTGYAFRIDTHGGYRVAFKLAAADTEQNNVKGQKRYFFPATDRLAAFDEDRRELTLSFVYRPLTEAEEVEFGKTKVQAKIIAARRDALLAAVPDVTLRGLLAWIPEGKEVCVLEMHLVRWTRKSTSDYFIHKDLKRFLEQELDFYIKNEILRLSDVDIAQEAQVQNYLVRLKAIRRIARQIIAFLAQIEDFQKRLFEKPKFILRSNWCVTLDRLPEALYAQIAANPHQWTQWEALGMPVPLEADRNADFLQTHSGLMVDTALYPIEFKDAVLAALSAREGGLAVQRDGLLIHGENYQALHLLQPAFAGSVKCIYIDPPYNLGGDDFLYKDAFPNSTWLAMMEDRLRLGHQLLGDDGVLFISIDDNEQAVLKLCADGVFGGENFVTQIIWQKKYSPQNDARYLSDNHDYVTIYAKQKQKWKRNLLPRTEDANARYSNPDNDPRGIWKPSGLDVKTYTIEYDYPITTPSGRVVKPPRGRCWAVPKHRLTELIADNRIWFGPEGNSVPAMKRFLTDVQDGMVPLTIWTYDEVGHNQEAKQTLKAILGELGEVFQTPKPVRLLKRCIEIAASRSSIVLDFFAGSGTTGHAVINLNYEDNGRRQYILVEQGNFFYTVLKPRLQKVVYASDWKDGKPVIDATSVSHAFEYLALESYEDTLDNLDLDRAAAPQPGLFPPEQDDYLLRYFLDHETRQARFNLSIFEHPFQASMRARRDGVEQRLPLDLVATANYLLGLTVTEQIAFTHQERTYRLVQGQIGQHSVALLWRDTPGLNLAAEAAYIQAEIFSQGLPDRLFVNGDSHIPEAQPVQQVFVQAMLEKPQGTEEA